MIRVSDRGWRESRLEVVIGVMIIDVFIKRKNERRMRKEGVRGVSGWDIGVIERNKRVK